MVPRDSPFNAKLCGVLFSPQHFSFADKIPKYRTLLTSPKIHFIITHFGGKKVCPHAFGAVTLRTVSSYLERYLVNEYNLRKIDFFNNLIKMIHILIPETFNLALFLKAFFFNRYPSDFPKKNQSGSGWSSKVQRQNQRIGLPTAVSWSVPRNLLF